MVGGSQKTQASTGQGVHLGLGEAAIRPPRPRSTEDEHSPPETTREGRRPPSTAGVWFQGGQEGEQEIILQEAERDGELEEDTTMSAAGVPQMRKGKKAVQLGKIIGKGCRAFLEAVAWE